MFDGLSGRLLKVFENLKSRGILTENDVNDALRDIRIALLEADVALPVAKSFIEEIKGLAIGEKVIRSVKPGEVVVKIVHDRLVELLGGGLSDGESKLIISKPPSCILLVGLQGSGKTTTAAKLALKLKKDRKKVLLCSLDKSRPAAMEQLAQLANNVSVEILKFVPKDSISDIISNAFSEAKLSGYEVIIFDTAGRISIDKKLMEEIKEIHNLTKPIETLLVLDAMTGQDSINIAKSFASYLDITGTILTRIDGDARGGAALSMRHVTGKPIKYLGTGEKPDSFEVFSAVRVANRILDMGDIVGIVEKAEEEIDEEEAKKMAAKISKGEFTLDDFSSQLKQMKKLGGMKSILSMLPGVKKAKNILNNANLDDGHFIRLSAIISSMTLVERRNTKIINGSRKKRIAQGSGTEIYEVNRLLKQFKGMQVMMKKMNKPGSSKMLNMLAGSNNNFINKQDIFKSLKNFN